MHLDFELQWLVTAVVAMLVIGLPLIVSRSSLPAQLQFEKITQDRLTPKQTEYFDGADAKLGPLGYHPLTTFRVVNLSGANLSRVYTSSSDPARILVALMSAPRGKMGHNYAENLTRYRDGAILTTKNSNLSTVFATMPGQIVQSFPGVEDLLELKRRHDAKAATLVSHGPLQRDDKTFFDDFRDYHKRFCDYQQSKKLLRFDERARIYRGTLRMALRGTANFLNPLADNFTVSRFAMGLLFGTVLPLIALYQPALLVRWLQPRMGLDPVMALTLLLGVAFTCAGVVVGSVFRQKSLIWAFLLGYVPIKLLGPAAGVGLGPCLWMALVAESVARWRMRREKLV